MPRKQNSPAEDEPAEQGPQIPEADDAIAVVEAEETQEDPDADVAELGYEDARDELVQIVSRLEGGSASLEESMRLWERGEKLAARCQGWLDSAERRLDAASAAEAEDDDQQE